MAVVACACDVCKIKMYTVENVEKFYAKILHSNGIQDEIANVEIIVPKLSDDFTCDYEKVKIHFVPTDGQIGGQRPTLELFIKKLMPDNKDSEDIRELELFEKESNFFNFFIPNLHKFCLQNSGIEEFLKDIIPKSYYADQNLIIMEDLGSKGYAMLPEDETHTFLQARKVLSILAKLHAATYALIMSEVDLDKFLKKYPFTKNPKRWLSTAGKDSQGAWLDRVIDGALKILKSHPQPLDSQQQKFLEYLSQFESHGAFLKLGQLFDAKNKKFRCGPVLNHGDAWNCNFLFRGTADDESADCLMIDFQTIHVGSPALDLQYYLYLAVKDDVRRQYWIELLMIYYKIFSNHVQSLGRQVTFSFDDLVSDYKLSCEVGFILGLEPVYFFDSGHVTIKEKNVDKILGTTDGHYYAEKIVDSFKNYQTILNYSS